MRVVKKACDRKKEIIQAAREHFQTEEYRTITMQWLIDKVGIAKGTLYHHFKSKSEILEAVVEDIVDEEFEHLKKLLEENKKLSAVEKFRLLLTANRLAEDNEQLLENLHHPENAQAHSHQLAKIVLKVGPLYADVIKQGCDEGVFNTSCPLEAAELLISGLQFFTDIGFFPWSNEQLKRRMVNFPSMLEAQLGAKKGTFDFLS